MLRKGLSHEQTAKLAELDIAEIAVLAKTL